MILARRGRALAGVCDQLLYSLSNVALTVIVARHSTTTEFGIFSVLLATFLIFSTVNRGVNAEPLMIRFSAAERETWGSASRNGAATALWLGLIVGAVLAGVTALALPSTYFLLGMGFAAGMPILYVQDFLRYVALAEGRPKLALINDGVAGGVQLVGFVLLIMTDHPQPGLFLFVWVAGALAGGGAGWVAIRMGRPTLVPAKSVVRDALAVRLGIDNLVTQLAQQGTAYLVVAVSGLATAGGLRAAQTVFGPFAVLGLSIQAGVLPELVRTTSMVAFRRTVLRLTRFFLLASLMMLAAALLCPDSVGSRLLGPSWFEGKPLLPFVGVAQMFAGIGTAPLVGLRALGDGRGTLRARSMALIPSVTAVAVGAELAGRRGIGFALIFGGVLAAVTWWRQFERTLRRATGLQRAGGRHRHTVPTTSPVSADVAP